MTLKRIYSQYLTNTTSLEEVSLSSNRIETIERFVISSMPDSIQRITAANNRLIFSWAMLEISYLKNLKYGDISRQSGASSSFLSLLANDCNDSKSYKQEDKDRLSYPYQLQSATKQKGKIESCLSEFITIPPRKHINIYICLPKSLQKILIHHNGLGQEEGIHHDGIGQEEGIPISNNMLFDFRHVKYINAKGNMFRSLLNSGSVLGKMSSVLDFSDNYISNIDHTWFQYANLSHLNLSGNFLDAYFKNEISGKLLENQFFIQNISLARNKIDRLPRDLFENTINLREIDLSNNQIENVQFIGPKLKRIKLLNLRGNFIHSLSKQEMKVLDSVASDRLTIDLSENDILCTCDTLNFSEVDRISCYRKSYCFSKPEKLQVLFSEFGKVQHV